MHTRETLPYFWVLNSTGYELPSKVCVPATYIRCVMVLEESHVYYAMPRGFQVLGTTNYEVPSEPSPYLRRVYREQMVPSSR